MAKSSEARIFPWYLFLFFDGVLKILSIQGQALLKIYVKFARNNDEIMQVPYITKLKSE